MAHDSGRHNSFIPTKKSRFSAYAVGDGSLKGASRLPDIATTARFIQVLPLLKKILSPPVSSLTHGCEALVVASTASPFSTSLDVVQASSTINYDKNVDIPP